MRTPRLEPARFSRGTWPVLILGCTRQSARFGLVLIVDTGYCGYPRTAYGGHPLANRKCIMKRFDRRTALTIGLAAASAAVVKPAASQTMDYKETSPAPGVVLRVYGETPAM